MSTGVNHPYRNNIRHRTKHVITHEQIACDVQLFLDRGGEIKRIPIGQSAQNMATPKSLVHVPEPLGSKR